MLLSLISILNIYGNNDKQRCWWSKYLPILMTRGTTSLTKHKVAVSDATFPWWISPLQKIKEIDWFPRDIDEKIILKSNRWEKHLAKLNQNWMSQILLYIDDHLHSRKKLRNQLTLSKDVHNQRIRQSVWKISTAGFAQL